MRKTISDEIIEIAKRHENLNERIEIYWKMMVYYIEWKIVDERMRKYLEMWAKISEKLKGNKNRCGTVEKTTVAELKNNSGRVKKNNCGTTEKTHTKPTKTEITDEALAIYISNNNRLYIDVSKYIETNKEYWSISYQINKQWKERYIYSQMKESEKLVKEIWFKEFEELLNYISNDDFRSKQILSIAKLNRKNKEWIPYYLVIKDKMKPHTIKDQEKERQIELHRQKIREQIESFNSQPKQNAETWLQDGWYNRRQNIQLSEISW